MVRRLANKMKIIAIKAFFWDTFEIRIADSIAVSIVVSIADCHSEDRSLIPRQRELFR